MSQHFLLSTAARTLSLAKVMRLSDDQAFDIFKGIRWAANDGESCTNQAESFFSRLRRAEIGMHHHIAGKYLSAYATEMAWREDNRRVSNGEQFLMATSSALAHPVSRQWKGYWQR